MPDMPEMVSKGSILKRLDALSRNSGKLRRLLNDLKASDAPDIPEIAERHGLVTPWEKQHLRQDWFTDWWPDAQPVEPLVAAGVTLATQEALRRRLPLDCFWMCHTGHEEGGDHDHEHRTDDHEHGGHEHGPGHYDHHQGPVEIAVCWSDQQVTLMIHTPEPGSVAPGDLTELEPVKIVKRVNGVIKIVQPKHRP